MKKFLSLVLALVMTMSLVTVSAGAKGFADDSKINYDEAVAVMSTLGVVGGYADGSFNPNGTLTRGAAAKIICNVILGTTTANALVAKTAPYKDVPANHTFAGYIAYCQKEGIISGYADGTFKPANTLTGYAFMKMLLGALGLDAEVEGYTGPNWSISVAKRALSDTVDLADGLKGDFNGVKAVTREEACLYAFNMIKAGKFSYPTSSTIVVGNVTVKNNSKAEQGNVPYYKDVFTKLTVGSVDKDELGRPATQWKYDGKEIGVYAETPDAIYVGEKVKSKDLYADLDLDSEVATGKIQYYVDGDTTAAPYKITKSDDSVKDKKFGATGSVLEAYVIKNDDGTVKNVVLALINTYVGDVDDVDKNDDKERIVTVDGIDYVTNEFEEDDKVIYTKGLDDGDEVIMSMAKVEKKTGTLTKTVDDKYTIGGTAYTLNSNCDDKDDYKVKDDVDFYLDANGYIIYIEASEDEANLSNMAYVVEAGKSAGDYYAILRLADGSKKKVDADKDYSGLAHQIVTFKDTKDGVKLTKKSTASTVKVDKTSGVGTVSFEKGKPTFKLDGTKLFKTDSKTVFVYATTNDGDTEYKSYTGYKTAPSIDTTVDGAKVMVVSAYVKNDIAVMVYVDMTKEAIGTTASDLTFVAYDEGADWTDEGDDVAYYELNAVVDGKITTVKVSSDTYTEIATRATADELVAATKGMTYDSDNIATKLGTAPDAADLKQYTAVKAAKNDTLKFANGTGLEDSDYVGYAYADDVLVFFVDGCDITAGKISEIREDNNGTKNPYKQILVHTDDDEIDVIFLVKK